MEFLTQRVPETLPVPPLSLIPMPLASIRLLIAYRRRFLSYLPGYVEVGRVVRLFGTYDWLSLAIVRQVGKTVPAGI